MNSANILDQVSAAESRAQGEALRTYRALLDHADRPGKGDAQALAAAMATLGLTTSDVRADLAALHELRAAEGRLVAENELETLAQASAAASRAVVAHVEESRRKQQELVEIEGVATQRYREATDAARTAQAIRRRLEHQAPRLFGKAVADPQPAPPTQQWAGRPVPEPAVESRELPRVASGAPRRLATIDG